MTKKGLIGILLLIFILSIAGCRDDDELQPITLKDEKETTLRISHPSPTTGYTFSLQGGDGNYSVKSGNEDIVTTEMTGSTDFSIKVINVGETTVTVTDNSQHVLVLDIIVDYETINFKIKSHDVVIIGDELTNNERRAIQEKVLANIPVKIGGGYKFMHTDIDSGSGKAIIYTDTFGDKGIETTFEYIKAANELQKWGYEILFNNEKRFLFIDRYYPSTKSSSLVPMALVEDVTEVIKEEFPNVERVGSFQVLDSETYENYLLQKN